MKISYIFGLIILVEIASSCNNNKLVVNNDLKEWGLQGEVKMITEIDYSNSGKYTTYLQFNPYGFVQKQSSFNPDGSLIRKWEYKNNARNQKLVRYCYVLKDSLSGILHYSYNKDEKIVEEKLLNPKGGLISNTIHEYDGNLNEIERKFLNENSKILSRVSYKYGNKKYIIEELHSDSVTRQFWKQKNIYNPQGLNVEILYVTLKDSLVNRSTYSYLSNKQVGEVCSYNGKSELISKNRYEYDNQLNITGKLMYYALEKTSEKRSFVYKYDQHNNWTSRYEYINNKLDDMITRKLEYYE